MSHTNMRFCYACAMSASKYMKSAINEHSDILSAESINSFLLSNVPQCLLCMAESMTKKSKNNHMAPQRFQKIFNDMVENDFMKDMIIYLDSAGFQIQQGYIQREHLLPYAKEYYQFIHKNADKIGYAFTLDFAPSTDISVFSSHQEVYELNYKSYKMATELPEDLQDKMLAIMHFRGPNLYKTFRSLLFKDGFAKHFNRFAVGGLAVSGNISQDLPCFPYTIPLTDILKHAIDRGLKTLHFHVLGNATQHDVLMHCLVEKHVQTKYGITLNITHDASSAFKTPIKDRHLWIPDIQRKSIRNISIKSQSLPIVSPGYGSAKKEVFAAVDKVLVPHGLGPFTIAEHPFYVDRNPGVSKKYEDKKASTLGNFLPMMLMLNAYAQLDEWCEQASAQLYPYYEAGQIEGFEKDIASVIICFGSKSDLKMAHGVAKAMTKSLDMLSELDLDLSLYLVQKHLYAHEHPSIQQPRMVA